MQLQALLSPWVDGERWCWPFHHPNILGFAVVVTMLMVLLAEPRIERRLGVWLQLSCVSFLGIVLVGTGSRGAAVALVMGLLVAWLWFPGGRRMFSAAGMVVAMGWLFRPDLLVRAAEILVNSETSSVGGRYVVWEGYLSLLADHKLGYLWSGLRSEEVYWMFYAPESNCVRYGNAINEYLDISARFGVPVLAVLLTALFVCASLAHRMKRKIGLGIGVLPGAVLASYLAMGSTTAINRSWEIWMVVLCIVVTVGLFSLSRSDRAHIRGAVVDSVAVVGPAMALFVVVVELARREPAVRVVAESGDISYIESQSRRGSGGMVEVFGDVRDSVQEQYGYVQSLVGLGYRVRLVIGDSADGTRADAAVAIGSGVKRIPHKEYRLVLLCDPDDPGRVGIVRSFGKVACILSEKSPHFHWRNNLVRAASINPITVDDAWFRPSHLCLSAVQGALRTGISKDDAGGWR